MAKNTTPDHPAAVAIATAEEHAASLCEIAKSLSAHLSRAKKELQAGFVGGGPLRQLLANLKKLPAKTPVLDIESMTRELEAALKKIEASLREDFPRLLQSACSDANLPFKSLSDTFAVGPFSLEVNFDSATGHLLYAHVPVGDKLQIAPDSIVDVARTLQEAIVNEKVNVKQLTAELEEAMRVAEARRGTQSNKRELRAELPAVYREWSIIREFGGGTRKKMSPAAISLARFIVELKQFTQSAENMQAEQPLQLEPAVIENTKNARKSLFIPRDLNRGYGEGTYFQAIVRRN